MEKEDVRREKSGLRFIFFFFKIKMLDLLCGILLLHFMSSKNVASSVFSYCI